MASIPQTVHYSAEIVNTRVDRGAGRYGSTSYRTTVILSDGSQTSIDVSKHNYDEVLAGKEKVVCENEGMFGIQFINLHDLVKK